MADYSFVRDENQKVVGMWFHDPANAHNSDMIAAALYMKLNLPQDQIEAVLHNYRVVPNNFDNTGGCFVMFGSTPAPGEKTTSSPEQAISTSSEKKWWQFWK